MDDDIIKYELYKDKIINEKLLVYNPQLYCKFIDTNN